MAACPFAPSQGLSEELQTFVSDEKLEQCVHEVTFDYSCLNSSQVLKVRLPWILKVNLLVGRV